MRVRLSTAELALGDEVFEAYRRSTPALSPLPARPLLIRGRRAPGRGRGKRGDARVPRPARLAGVQRTRCSCRSSRRAHRYTSRTASPSPLPQPWPAGGGRQAPDPERNRHLRLLDLDGDGDHYVRQFRDMKVIPRGDLIAPRLAQFATACGRVLARAHARTGDPIAIAAYIGRDAVRCGPRSVRRRLRRPDRSRPPAVGGRDRNDRDLGCAPPAS